MGHYLRSIGKNYPMLFKEFDHHCDMGYFANRLSKFSENVLQDLWESQRVLLKRLLLLCRMKKKRMLAIPFFVNPSLLNFEKLLLDLDYKRPLSKYSNHRHLIFPVKSTGRFFSWIGGSLSSWVIINYIHIAFLKKKCRYWDSSPGYHGHNVRS